MPIYEYKCANGHVFETVQSMAADPVTECEVCGAPVERVYHPVAVHFKGSGFYSTDYGSKSKGSDGAKERDSSKSDSGSDSGSKSKDSKTDSKSKATSTSSDD